MDRNGRRREAHATRWPCASCSRSSPVSIVMRPALERPRQHPIVAKAENHSLRRAPRRPDAKGSPSVSAPGPQRDLCSVARRTNPKRTPRAEVPDPQGRPAGVPGPRRRTPARWNPRERNDLTWGQSSDYEIKSIGSSTTFRTRMESASRNGRPSTTSPNPKPKKLSRSAKNRRSIAKALRNPDITVAELFGEFFRNQTQDTVRIGFRTLRGDVSQLHRAGDR